MERARSDGVERKAPPRAVAAMIVLVTKERQFESSEGVDVKELRVKRVVRRKTTPVSRDDECQMGHVRTEVARTRFVARGRNGPEQAAAQLGELWSVNCKVQHAVTERARFRRRNIDRLAVGCDVARGIHPGKVAREKRRLDDGHVGEGRRIAQSSHEERESPQIACRRFEGEVVGAHVRPFALL